MLSYLSSLNPLAAWSKSASPHTTTDIKPEDSSARQLALPTAERVVAKTQFGDVVGGRTKNGAQVFLSTLPFVWLSLSIDVPYGLDGPRWTDPEPLPEGYKYSTDFVKDGKYCAQPDPLGYITREPLVSHLQPRFLLPADQQSPQPRG